MHRLISCFAVAWLLISNTSLAGNDASKPLPVGSLVLAKRPGVHFRIKNKDVEVMHCGIIERVQKVQGEWLWLGRGWVGRQDVVSLPEAAKYFTAEIQRRPTAFAYVGRAAAKGREGGFTSETDKDIDQALKLDSKFAPAYYVQGLAFLERMQFDAAEKALAEAIRYDLTADALNDLGRVWHVRVVADTTLGPDWYTKGAPGSNGLAKLLLKQFDMVIRLSPRLAKAYRDRAAVLRDAGDYDGAFSDTQESLKHDPDDSAGHRLVGEYWVRKDNDERALCEFDEAVRLNPKCGKARFDRAKIYLRQGDDEQALADLNLAVQYLPRNAEVFKARGLIYYRTGRIEESRADRLAAARLEPKEATAASKTNTCGESKSKSVSRTPGWPLVEPTVTEPSQSGFAASNDASASKNASSETPPKPAETPRSRARALDFSARRVATCTDERYLNGERAVEAATQACELTDWKVADFVDTLAAAYAQSGDFDAAVKWQTKAIELDYFDRKQKLTAQERLDLYRAHKPCREYAPGRLARDPHPDATVR